MLPCTDDLPFFWQHLPVVVGSGGTSPCCGETPLSQRFDGLRWALSVMIAGFRAPR